MEESGVKYGVTGDFVKKQPGEAVLEVKRPACSGALGLFGLPGIPMEDKWQTRFIISKLWFFHY